MGIPYIKAFWAEAKCWSRLAMAKKGCFHTSYLLPTLFSLKTNFLTAINNLCNWCYFCYSKMSFFMTKEFFCQKWRLPYSQHNKLIPLIFLIIGQYLIHSVRPLSFCWGEGWLSYQIFKKGGLDSVSVFRRGCWERRGDLFPGKGGEQFVYKK